MVSVPRHRRNRKIRQAGQRVALSQAVMVAQEAGKAAPAIAAAGALTVALQVRKPAPHGRAAAKQVAHLDAHLARRFTARSGDTMPGIAQRFYGHDAARPRLYRVSCAAITDPGLISPGQVLAVPVDPPASWPAYRRDTGGTDVPRHAARRPASTGARAWMVAMRHSLLG